MPFATLRACRHAGSGAERTMSAAFRCVMTVMARSAVVQMYARSSPGTAGGSAFLAKVARKQPFELSIDRAFARVIDACAERDETWIGTDISRLYLDLHRLGSQH